MKLYIQQFVWSLNFAWRAYKMARSGSGTSYTAFCWHGVPQATAIVAIGRDAWRVSNFAIEVRGIQILQKHIER